MTELSQVSVVLPSLDPDEKLLTVVDGLLKQGFDDIILINDGSRQENLSRLRNEIENADAIVIGAGAGLSELQRGGLSGAD